jgi:ribulose-phosphate 3-epimerase
MKHVIPTVFSHSKPDFIKRLKTLLPASKFLQVDFMDGVFVKDKSVSLSSVPNLSRYNNFFEAHLMVASPSKWIKNLKTKGFKKVIFHYESLGTSDECRLLINDIQLSAMQAFVAINPDTPISKIKDLLNDVDGVLVMGVNPGKEHQELIMSSISKIKQLRKLDKSLIIQIDGGVTLDNIKRIVDSGVTEVNSGSLVYTAPNPRAMVKKLESYF